MFVFTALLVFVNIMAMVLVIQAFEPITRGITLMVINMVAVSVVTVSFAVTRRLLVITIVFVSQQSLGWLLPRVQQQICLPQSPP